jgi:hypothetical protein
LQCFAKRFAINLSANFDIFVSKPFLSHFHMFSIHFLRQWHEKCALFVSLLFLYLKVQKYAFPIVLSGRALMACAPTGSGGDRQRCRNAAETAESE